MRQWDRLVDAYVEEYRGRGTCEATVAHTASKLVRWGRWMKSRRPRPAIEAIDAELITRYLEHRAHPPRERRASRPGSRGSAQRAAARSSRLQKPRG